MTYYLSYIEIKGHSALMLSQQVDPSLPARIVCELGFAYSPDIPQNAVGYLTTHKGYLREESNAGRALYSKTSDVKHRSYEISEAEARKFFQIINRDKQINLAPIEPEKGVVEVQYIGGPDYQKVRNNCKTYAMGVLKEMGIIDAQNLSNFLIQRTKTKTSLFQPLSKEELSCPLKENLLAKITSVLNEINQETLIILENINHSELDEDSKNELKEVVKNIKTLSSQLLENKEKVSIMVSMNKRFEEISASLDSVAPYTPHNISHFKDGLSEIVSLSKKVTDLSNKGQLEFFWKSTPPVANRLMLNNFTPQERAAYLVKIKGSEVADGLELVLMDFNHRINKLRSFDKELYLDLSDLKHIIENAKKEIDTANQSFLTSMKTKEALGDVTYICAKQKKAINAVIGKLESDLAGFKPRTPESSVFIRYLNQLIRYFKKDFLTVENTESLIKDKISTLKHASKILDYKLEVSGIVEQANNNVHSNRPTKK
jgi:hypothetical protein